MTNEEIKPGTLVRLKSGGPRMTVTSTYMGTPTPGVPSATCVWFNDDRTHDSIDVPTAALRVVSETEPA